MIEESLILFIFTLVFGYIIAVFASGKREGDGPAFIFEVEGWMVHPHHWVVGVLVILLLVITGVQNPAFYGFMAGLVMQGLSYKDFGRIIYKK